MFALQVNKNQIRVVKTEPMTSGSKTVYPLQFQFSDEWAYLNRVAVFATDVGPDGPIEDSVYNQILDDTNKCFIPWEVTHEHRHNVFVGVFGTMNGEVVLPTVWADIGSVLLGVTTGLDLEPPTPEIYEQVLNELGFVKDQLKNLEAGSALDVHSNEIIDNVNQLGTLPRSVVMVNSSLTTDNGMNWAFGSEVIHVEQESLTRDANQNGSIVVTDIANKCYRFSYNEDGLFTTMSIVKTETPEVDLSDYYTKSEVDEKLEGIGGGENVDLSDYYTKEEVDEKIDGIETGETVDLSGYATKAEVEERVKNIELTPGPKGEPGENAYQLAKENGFPGTLLQWFESLRGETGTKIFFTHSDIVETFDPVSLATVTLYASALSGQPRIGDLFIRFVTSTSDGKEYLCFYEVISIDDVSIQGVLMTSGQVKGGDGENGKDGLDYLIANVQSNDPPTSPTMNIPKSSFSRKPVEGDKFLLFYKYTATNHLYIGKGNVTDLPDNIDQDYNTWQVIIPTVLQLLQDVTGADGVSPTVSVSEIDGGHKVSITDVNGTQEFNVMDGVDGAGGSSAIEGDIPVKPITTEEYNALSEEEKNSETAWLVTDAEGGSAGSGSSSGESAGEVYSTEETRIGTWIDGKPLYRKVVSGYSANVLKSWVSIGDVILDVDSVASICGMYKESNEIEDKAFPCEGLYVQFRRVSGDPDHVQTYVTLDGLKNKPVTAIIEYTKTTD